MGWESHHSRSTHPRHLGQHSANLSPATPMCLLSSPDSDLFLSAQGAGFNRPYTLNNYQLPLCVQDWAFGGVNHAYEECGDPASTAGRDSLNRACPVRRAGCGNGVTVRQLRHRQTKGAATVETSLRPPRHISTQLSISPLVQKTTTSMHHVS